MNGLKKIVEFTGKVAMVTLEIMIVAVAAGIATETILSTGKKISGFVKEARSGIVKT